MIFWIGQDVWHQGTLVHIQDTDAINACALVGVPDTNQIVWDTYWVPFKKLSKVQLNNS